MSSSTLLRAALGALIALQTIMLFSLFAGVPPHPPVAVAPFSMGPFLGAAIAIAFAARTLADAPVAGRVLAGLAALAALVFFGPQKYADPAFRQIWPAVLTAQAAIGAVAWAILHPRGALSSAMVRS